MSVVDDREAFIEFTTEAQSIFSELITHFNLAEEKVDVDYLFRSYHTIKAGCFSFHFLGIAESIHELESHVYELRGQIHEELMSSLPTLKKKTEEIKSIFEEAIEQYGSVINDSSSYDFALAFKRYEKIVLEVAEKQEKKVDLIIEPSYVYVSLEKYKRFIAATIHIFRNAIDHGIEDTGTREMCGKDSKALINVTCSKVENEIKISISDDGQGIDSNTIGRLAVEKKVRSQTDIDKMSEDEIVQLIFAAGFSTKTEVTNLSGRGVGLDSVKFEAEGLGGSVFVKTKAGEGSEFIITLPI